MAKQKVVLAYSGGLDTSVAIKWLQDQYDFDVVACGIDLGEDKDPEALRRKAEQIGAVKGIMIDAKRALAEEYILPALKGNALYEGKYPLSTAVARPLIAKLLVDVAEQEGAVGIAHGCTGKGNDQVRFEVCIGALNPDLQIFAPVRDWGMNRDEEIEYAQVNNIPVPVQADNPFSIDANIWGRACEAGVLEDPWVEAPEEAFTWTNPISLTPDEPEYVEIAFEKGIPVAVDGEFMDLVTLIETLNEKGGLHGVGRIDHIENRLVGIKSREVYENPAALILINAHKELEYLTHTREVLDFKTSVEQKLANLIYDGLWFSPLKAALDAFIDETQEVVTGYVRVRLHKGNHFVTGRKSINSLYSEALATYADGDHFDHKAAEGFIKLWGLTTKVYAQVHKANKRVVEEVS